MGSVSASWTGESVGVGRGRIADPVLELAFPYREGSPAVRSVIRFRLRLRVGLIPSLRRHRRYYQYYRELSCLRLQSPQDQARLALVLGHGLQR